VTRVSFTVCNRGCLLGTSIQGPLESVAHLFADLAERLLLELANAFPGQVVLVADFVERQLFFVVEPKAPADDARFDRREKPADLHAAVLLGQNVRPPSSPTGCSKAVAATSRNAVEENVEAEKQGERG